MPNAIIRNLKILMLLADTSPNHPVTVETLRAKLAEEDLDVSARQLQRDLAALSCYFAISNNIGERRKHLWFAYSSKDLKTLRQHEGLLARHPVNQ